jgi:hypothetical protein
LDLYRSNESRINGPTHHPEEGSYQSRNVLTNHRVRCSVQLCSDMRQLSSETGTKSLSPIKTGAVL